MCPHRALRVVLSLGERIGQGLRTLNAICEMTSNIMQTLHLFATVEPAGLPALRVISVIAALIFAGIGVYIYRRRHQLFDRDPEITQGQDGSAQRHVRLELVVIIWGALMLVMLATLYGIWRA
jgi:hypothetical protein